VQHDLQKAARVLQKNRTNALQFTDNGAYYRNSTMTKQRVTSTSGVDYRNDN